MSGIQADVTNVANDATDIGAVAAKATEIGLLGQADVIADMAILATADVVADMNTLATADIVSDLNTLADSDIIDDLNKLATTDIVNDLNTLATTDNVNNMNTVADNISSVNNFASQYRVASSAPTSSLDEGDLYYNTTSNTFNYYNGSAWTAIANYVAGAGIVLTGNSFSVENDAVAMSIALG